MKIKLGLWGGSGKMGKAVEQMLPLFKGENEIIPFLFVGKNSSSVFAISCTDASGIEAEVLKDVDIWIDFTSDKGFLNLLEATKNYNTPVVSGSTGLSDKDFVLVKKQSAKRPIFWASNMSPGLWAFRQALRGLKSIAHFDFAVEEIHHTQKKDRPSGTAKTIQAEIESVIGRKIETPTSFRLGGVFGEHRVLAASSNEVISLQHQALNRTVFAEGALIAADWLVQKSNGYYSVDDLFETKNTKRR